MYPPRTPRTGARRGHRGMEAGPWSVVGPRHPPGRYAVERVAYSTSRYATIVRTRAKYFPLVEGRALYVASLGLAVSDRGCAVRGGSYLRQRYVLQLFIDDRVHRGGAHLLGDLDAKGADVCHLKHDAGLLGAFSIIHAP